LTRTRIGAEVRAITRCSKGGIRVPGIRLVDARNGLLGLELIEGKSVRQILPGAEEEEEEEDEYKGEGEEEGEEMEEDPQPEELVDSVKEFGVTHG
jgi:TP53 regulating kinase and related kinases